MNYHDPIEPDKDVLEDIRKNFRYDPETRRLERRDKRSGTWGEFTAKKRVDGRPQQIKVYHPKGHTNIYPHHVIFFLYYGFWPNRGLDHINKECISNDIANLELSGQRLNSLNKNTKYGLLPGVAMIKGRNKPYIAQIRKDGKHKSLGYFKTEIGAHEAYRKAYKEIEGVELKWPYLPWSAPQVIEIPLSDVSPKAQADYEAYKKELASTGDNISA